MTGRGAATSATTPQGRKSRAQPASHAANQATRAPRFEGMERMYGKAEEPPSDAAGTPAAAAGLVEPVLEFQALLGNVVRSVRQLQH